MTQTEYNHFTNEELCRRVMSEDASPLERELAQRLEAVIFRQDVECNCIECNPKAWS